MAQISYPEHFARHRTISNTTHAFPSLEVRASTIQGIVKIRQAENWRMRQSQTSVLKKQSKTSRSQGALTLFCIYYSDCWHTIWVFCFSVRCCLIIVTSLIFAGLIQCRPFRCAGSHRAIYDSDSHSITSTTKFSIVHCNEACSNGMAFVPFKKLVSHYCCAHSCMYAWLCSTKTALCVQERKLSHTKLILMLSPSCRFFQGRASWVWRRFSAV